MPFNLSNFTAGVKTLLNNVPVTYALSLHGDSVYLFDADEILSSNMWDIGTKLLLETAKEVVSNVIGEYVSFGNATVDILSYANTYLEMILGKGYFGDQSWYYKFRINPNRLSIARRKLQSATHYGWGLYDLEYFGDEIVVLSFSGKTGNMMPPAPLPSLGIWDPRLSVPYIKLAQLEKFYRKTNNRLFITVYGRVYYGFLSDLTYNLDAENPRKIEYSFTFNAHPGFIFDVFTGNFESISEINPITWASQVKASVLQQGAEYIEGLKNYIPFRG